MAPIQNAMRSVRDVIVMDTAADRNVFAMRSSTESLTFPCRHSVISWNMSSVPIPARVKISVYNIAQEADSMHYVTTKGLRHKSMASVIDIHHPSIEMVISHKSAEIFL